MAVMDVTNNETNNFLDEVNARNLDRVWASAYSPAGGNLSEIHSYGLISGNKIYKH